MYVFGKRECLHVDLVTAYGKGSGWSDLLYMRKLYLSFPIRETLPHKLSWNHYYELAISWGRLCKTPPFFYEMKII